MISRPGPRAYFSESRTGQDLLTAPIVHGRANLLEPNLESPFGSPNPAHNRSVRVWRGATPPPRLRRDRAGARCGRGQDLAPWALAVRRPEIPTQFCALRVCRPGRTER